MKALLIFLCFAVVYCVRKDFVWPKEVPDTTGWGKYKAVPIQDNSKWMEKNWEKISQRTLQELTLPGTHDSGSWSVTDELLGVPEWLDVIVKVADFLRLPVGTIIDWWARSQLHNFYDQFNAGIRYVDVRIIFDNSKGYWRTHHGVVLGTRLEVLFQHTQQFLRENTKEVLVLELSHSNSVNSTTHKTLIDMIEKYLGSNLWPAAKGFVPLQQMIDSGKNVILTLRDGNSDIWPEDTIINSYANSDDLETMEKYNLNRVEEYVSHPKPSLNLWKISWTLTPNVDTILEMVLPGKPHTLIELADIANADLDNWFNTTIAPRGFKYPILANIVIIDHYDASDIVGIVVRGLTN